MKLLQTVLMMFLSKCYGGSIKVYSREQIAKILLKLNTLLYCTQQLESSFSVEVLVPLEPLVLITVYIGTNWTNGSSFISNNGNIKVEVAQWLAP